MIVLSNATGHPIFVSIHGQYVNLRPGDFIKKDSVMDYDITSPDYNVDRVNQYIDEGVLIEKVVYQVPLERIPNRFTFMDGWTITGNCTIYEDRFLQSPEPEVKTLAIFRPGYIVYKECLVYGELIAIGN